jgi:hypothetical protein
MEAEGGVALFAIMALIDPGFDRELGDRVRAPRLDRGSLLGVAENAVALAKASVREVGVGEAEREHESRRENRDAQDHPVTG